MPYVASARIARALLTKPESDTRARSSAAMSATTRSPIGYVLRGTALLAASALVVAWGQAAWRHEAPTWALLANAVLFVPGWVFALAGHEAAHACAGQGLGLYLWRIRLGAGPALSRWRWRGCDIHVHASPLSGGTLLCPRDDGPWRWRMWAAVAAGPIMSAALMAVSAWGARRAGGLHLYDAVSPLGAFALANAFTLVASLFPGTMQDGSGFWAQSDGKRLLTLPRAPHLEEQLRGARAMLEAEEARERGDLDEALRRCEQGLRSAPDSKLLRHQQAVVLLQKGDMASARRVLVEIREAMHLQGQLRAAYENDIAWANVFLDDQTLVNEAFEYARANVRLRSGAGWAHRTYGAVLVRRGKLDAAVSELLLAWQLNDEEKARAHNAAWLAAAEARRGKLSDARRWLAAARSLDPDSYSLPVAVQAIAEAECQGGREALRSFPPRAG